MNLSIGKVFISLNEGKRYRIIGITEDAVILCEMDITKLSIIALTHTDAIDLLVEGKAVLEEDEGSRIVELDKYTENVVERFRLKKAVFCEVEEEYGPTYLRLMGRGPKPQLMDILERNGLSVQNFWPSFRRYLQGGMKECDILDRRALGNNKGKEYVYTTKTGRPPVHNPDQGIPCNSEEKKHFKEALKWFKGSRKKTMHDAYVWMLNTFYSKDEFVNNELNVELLPESQCPTETQFRDFARNNLSQKELDIVKTSAQEVRNNKRLINSDVCDDVYGPGDMAEIDAIEMDISLVSTVDENLTVGAPTVYVAVDVRSGIILAISVGFDQNSYLGISSLFLNLADNKKEVCRRYGILMDEKTIKGLWPSNIIPRRVRVDRGSEFTSQEFTRFCNELHIEKQVVSGGSGSLKGLVERVMGRLEEEFEPVVENKGLRTKRHDSKHHKQAMLNVHAFTAILINEVLAFNQHFNSYVQLDADLLKDSILATPAYRWNYWIGKYGNPRPITDIEHYRWTLMSSIKPNVSRSGITYKGLNYLTDDLDDERYSGSKNKIPFRMDMRSVDSIFYLKDGHMKEAPLNENRQSNASFKGLTMAEYERFLKKAREMKHEGDRLNLQIEADSSNVIEGIVEAAEKPTYSISKNMRQARHAEKQRISAEGKISKLLTSDEKEEPQPAEPESELDHYSSFSEALENFRENH